MTPEHPKPNDLWKRRRRITYSCLVAALVVVGVYLYEPSRFQGTESVFTAIFIFFGSVVGCYMGFSSYENVRMK